MAKANDTEYGARGPTPMENARTTSAGDVNMRTQTLLLARRTLRGMGSGGIVWHRQRRHCVHDWMLLLDDTDLAARDRHSIERDMAHVAGGHACIAHAPIPKGMPTTVSSSTLYPEWWRHLPQCWRKGGGELGVVVVSPASWNSKSFAATWATAWDPVAAQKIMTLEET